MNADHHERGHIGEGVMNTLKNIASDFARHIVDFACGDIDSRSATPALRQRHAQNRLAG
jgi:4-carboxymuconolactone decarboxylase